MMSIIKTAIITIVISFISGVLLDYYKNYSPRIVCTLMKIKSKTYSSRNIKVYSLMVKNISNKTLHDLNINLQGESDNLKMEYTSITKGLKYEIEHEGKDYDVRIPFLSKDDEFKTKVFMTVDNEHGNKPVITLRSPENFKQIGSCKEDSAVSEALNSLFNHKKTIISIISILIIVYIGILGGEYYMKTAAAKINTDNAGKTPAVQNLTPALKAENKSKPSENKSPVSQNNKNKTNSTKKSTVDQNSDNNISNTDNKNSESSKSQNNPDNQKEENTGNKSTGNSENKDGSTDGSSKQSGSEKNTFPEQNKEGSQSSGSDNGQNTGGSDKTSEGGNK